MKIDKRKLVGACGNYCGKCSDYIAYVTKDSELKKKVAEEIKKQFGMDISPEKIACEGCWGDIHNAWAASLECKIRQCALTKGILTCAECDSFPCKTYNEQFDNHSQQAKNINSIKQIGIDSWLLEM
ncbi:MAG: DUF3795 domain-containing protein [Phycisphaerae bacterium]|nr:DUF3795 domain-containing protein [Phycisphaerae bacterium]